MLGVYWLLLLLLTNISYETAPGVLQDYCENDYFQAECPPGSIVIIEEARYGRMELGTCLVADFGYLNCYSDVLAVLDQWCSGRFNCRVKVTELIDFRSSCTTDLASYLQARYTCESVMMPDRYCCETPGDRVTLTGSRGMIANYVTQSSGCGGVDCPWFIETSPGQIFNISLFDFSTFKGTETGHGNPGRDCEIYAKINEADGATVTICSGDIRYKHVYTTISNSVEVQIIKAGENGDESHYFAITYQAFGCSYPKAPIDGFIDMQGDRAVITCKFSSTQWELKCKDGQWIGDFKDCTETRPDHDEGVGNFYFTRDVYMVLVIAIAFVLAVAIVTTGIVCLYRYWNPIPSNGHTRTDHLTGVQMPDGTYLAPEFNYSLPRNPKGYDTVAYKYHTGGRIDQRKYPFSENVRTGRENDKGYHSDHTYESPMHGHVRTAPGPVGYHPVDPEENKPVVDMCQGSNFDRTKDPRAKIMEGTLTFPRSGKPGNGDANIA